MRGQEGGQRNWKVKDGKKGGRKRISYRWWREAVKKHWAREVNGGHIFWCWTSLKIQKRGGVQKGDGVFEREQYLCVKEF